jgi:hypothetical protein
VGGSGREMGLGLAMAMVLGLTDKQEVGIP